MIELKTHYEFFEFGEKSIHRLLAPKSLINQIEADLKAVSDLNELTDNPYIVFSLNDRQIDEIYLYNTEIDSKIFILSIAVALHNSGLDFLIQDISQKTIIFPVLSIKKGTKLNIDAIKNIFSLKKIKPKEINFENAYIQYSGEYDISLEESKYKNCTFEVIIEKWLLKELTGFYNNFFKIWDSFPLKKYPNLTIYFNKNNVEDGILFDIKNCDVDKFHLNFIQDRLFFIQDFKGNPRLSINKLYITSREPSKNIEIYPQERNSSVCFSSDDNAIKLAQTIII